MLTLRRPELTRDLLAYRHRRLEAARAAAAAVGLPGAMFPWQSGSDGREETPGQLFNVLAGQWLADISRRQRHVGLAIAYSVIRYYQATGDIGFLAEVGGDLLIEICRLFAAMSTYDPVDDRFHIDGVMGPDEFHDGYPGRAGSGVGDNAYTNVVTAWLLHRSMGLLDAHDCGRLRDRHQVTAAETAHWDRLSRCLAVPMHTDGVISQFEGYERLPEFDWTSYRTRYANIGRLDLILAAEGDSPNNYRLCKQADVLMLFYLFSAEELREVLDRLGYPLPAEAIRATVDFYTARTSHGSTLSRVVHAWVSARADRRRAWTLFTDALQADLADTQGGTTREGIHVGAMAGTVDLILRCFAGLETRDDVLWLHPVLPPELTRAEFTILYRGQRVKVELSPHLVRLWLRTCEAHPITVCVEGDRTVLRPGDVYEAVLQQRDG
jgi:trehalose/maltose hydrolase-like predicted phosphorylase